MSRPVELEELQREGEEILDLIGPYLFLVEHYENEQVVRQRLKRRTDEVSKELDELSDRTKILKGKIVNYLQTINKCITDTGI